MAQDAPLLILASGAMNGLGSLVAAHEVHMKIDPDDYRVAEGKKVNLGKRPTRIRDPFASEKEFEAELKQRVEKIGKLQEMLYASDSHALLVVLQGMDTAGKDGIIEHVFSRVAPQGLQVHGFKAPSDEEVQHDFLWRCWKVLPERGHIGVFNRSYYEEVLVVRVHPEFLSKQGAAGDVSRKGFWKDRFRSIIDMERHLQTNATAVVKIFLHLSEEEQRQRLLARIDEPEKTWKFNSGDIAERARWKDYMAAYEDCLAGTSTDDAPWFIVPADSKDTARLIVADIVAGAMESLGLRYPETNAARRAELAAIREKLAGRR